MTTKRHRLGYEKSNNGCKTCKIRKVKCDETFPECHRCTSTGRHCDGPTLRDREFRFIAHAQQTVESFESSQALSTGSNSQTALNPRKQLELAYRVLQPPLWSTSHPSFLQQPLEERRAFSYFINVAAPLISGTHDLYLWGQIVPQIALRSEAVWNAVIAIGQLWEHPMKHLGDPKQEPNRLDQHQIQALKWYDRAIRIQRANYDEKNAAESVLTCTLFTSIELQKREFNNGFTMLRLGFGMMAQFLTAKNGACSGPLASALVNQYMRSACLILTSRLEPDFGTSQFSNLADARFVLLRLMYAIYGLLKETYYTLRGQGLSMVQLNDRRSFLTSSLLQLRQRLEHLIGSEDRSASNTTELEFLCDYIDTFGPWLISDIEAINASSNVDNQLFQEIIGKAEYIVAHLIDQEGIKKQRPTFFHDVVLLSPLYFTATMSADPTIRHRAVDLMARHTSQIHGQQLHGLVAIADPERADGQPLLLQLFRNQRDEAGNETLPDIDTYARIMV